MATIQFTKTNNGYVATIVGTITKATTKLLTSYANRKNLDVQSINIIEEKPLFPTQWEQHVASLASTNQPKFEIKMY